MKNKDVYIYIDYEDGSSTNTIINYNQTNFYISMESRPKRINAPKHYENWVYMSAIDRFISNIRFIYGADRVIKDIKFEVIE